MTASAATVFDSAGFGAGDDSLAAGVGAGVGVDSLTAGVEEGVESLRSAFGSSFLTSGLVSSFTSGLASSLTSGLDSSFGCSFFGAGEPILIPELEASFKTFLTFGLLSNSDDLAAACFWYSSNDIPRGCCGCWL
ncbi:hypothetical protein WICMUC_001347 [Wickerhamomyces mucosus]|uniref:Uncharacterized protein n=1 Tax=Wickerhamomyces mucosus TaxID=1378264 RepID=A0A9P8PV13_9ASCO|nr:hypothetical protein WICMUC_001347 [Wickerhamomyces mucosus]